MLNNIKSIFMRLLAGLAFLLLVACGGGGGNPGTVSGGSSSTVVALPSVSVEIVDSSFAVVGSNSVSGGGSYFVQATLKDANGVIVNGKLVNFTTDTSVATLSQSAVLTNSSGVARVGITPVGVLSSAAATVTVNATVNSVSVSGSIDYQTAAANVALGSLAITTPSLRALQSTPVSVAATVNGIAAQNGQVSVNFTASCGAFSPSSATTSGSGVASSVYQSAVDCSGGVTLTAQASGSSVTSSSGVTVAAAQATNIIFSTATPSLMVTSQAAGNKQSSVVFRVLDQLGGGMSGQQLDIDLSSNSISAGVNFSVGGSLTSATQVVTTDASGNATVTVSSGTMPTPVQLTAKLHSNSSLLAYSSGLTVTSGVPAQDASSVSVDKFAIDGFTTDGSVANLTWSIADRQGNPIASADATRVNFVTRSSGILVGSCALDSSSRCTVTYTSAGVRPINGRVVILAYMDGEESFTDTNGNNRWDSGEPFNDIGTAYMDENESGNYALGEQTYPGGMVGASSCATTNYNGISVAGTCDGSWGSSVKVRQRIVLTLSDGQSSAIVTQLAARSLNGFDVRVADTNGNSMPTGTTVAATVVTDASTCKVASVSPNKVRNSPNAGNHRISLNGDAACATAKVEVTIVAPAPSQVTTVFSSTS